MEKHWHHPEMKKGEYLLGYFSLKEFNKNIGWKTKRLGDKVYGMGPIGSCIVETTNPRLYPVFIVLKEAEERGETESSLDRLAIIRLMTRGTLRPD